MSFRGELREFELPDIMQLIASQKKAGWLKIISGGNAKFVFFRDGKITSTKNPNQETDPFEEYLLRREILNSKQAERVAAICERTGMELRDVLQKEGLLDEAEIQETFETMIEEDVFDLMSIHTGTYEFETAAKQSPLEEGELYAEIGPILMEAARKADEVSEMRAALGPPEGVLVLTQVGREADIQLSEEEKLLSLVNGSRTIDQIVGECGLDRYTATRILFDVARRGWVGLMSRKGTTESPQMVREVARDRTFPLKWGAPIFVTILFSALLTNVLGSLRATDAILGDVLNRRAHHLDERDAERVKLALETFRVQTGSYPETLEFLTASGLLEEDRLFDDDGLRWSYSVSGTGEAFVLLRANGDVALEESFESDS